MKCHMNKKITFNFITKLKKKLTLECGFLIFNNKNNQFSYGQYHIIYVIIRGIQRIIVYLFFL